MPGTSDGNQPTRGFWVMSAIALLWNLIGIMTYVMSVTISPEALAAMSEADALAAQIIAQVVIIIVRTTMLQNIRHFFKSVSTLIGPEATNSAHS